MNRKETTLFPVIENKRQDKLNTLREETFAEEISPQNREYKFRENFFPRKLTGNKKVAIQLIEAWDPIKQLYKFMDSHPKSKHPKCMSYVTLIKG